ncbi:MAG TPA: pilus assembly protein PilM [Planctomycetota bacterium]
MSYGIDLGTSALKVAALRRTLNGWRVYAAARRRLPRPGEGKAAWLRLVNEAVGPSNGHRPAVVGLSGRDLNMQVQFQPAMPPRNYRVMMGYELEQRRGESANLYLDFCTLREPDAFFPQYLALIGIAKDTLVDERVEVLTKGGLDVRDAVPNAFALYAAYKGAYGTEDGTILLLDLGSDNMDIAFVRGGRLIFARNVSTGAKLFDQQVAGAMGCDPDDAEALKVARGNLGPAATEAEEEDELRGPVRSAAGQLAGTITSSINHAKVQLNDREISVDKVYLSGGGARLRGLPEYLGGALKIPVELLDPFRSIDTSALEPAVAEEFRQLPTDMAVAVGLAQLVAPAPALAASTLSILPEPLKKRKTFFRTWLWLGVAAGVLLASLLASTVLAFWKRSVETSGLKSFRDSTSSERERFEQMSKVSAEHRDLLARTDFLQSYLGGGRAALDVVSRLQKALPPAGITIREFRLGGRGGEDAGGAAPLRAAFVVKRTGPMLGEIEKEDDREVKLRDGAAPIPASDIEGEILRWPAGVRSLTVYGDVDENIRGGEPRKALNLLRDQLTDASRGMRATLQNQKSADRPGWRSFEILVTFE